MKADRYAVKDSGSDMYPAQAAEKTPKKSRTLMKA